MRVYAAPSRPELSSDLEGFGAASEVATTGITAAMQPTRITSAEMRMATTGDYGCCAAHPDYVGRVDASSVTGHDSIRSGHKPPALPEVNTSRAAKVRVVFGLIRLVRPGSVFRRRMSAKVLLHGVDTSLQLCPKCVRSTVKGSTPVEIAI
jgi:hypothetical protein